MYTAADLIHALQRRLQLIAPHLRRPPGEFPPGWQAWFASMQASVGAVRGATAEAIVGVLLQRPLAERPRSTGELTRWQAFNTLWRQEWQAPPPEDRKVRWFASAFTLLWHLVFVSLLLYFMYVRFLDVEEASKRRGEYVIQVEYIGQGTPEEAGGGQAQAPAEPAQAEEPAMMPEAATAEAMAAAVAPPASLPLSAEVPVPETAQRDAQEPQPPAPAQQPVAVSAPTPELSDFVLPPPTPRIAQPQLPVPQVVAPSRPLQAVEVPEPVQAIRRELPQQPVAPQIEARIPEVAQREVSAPVRAPVRPVATPSIAPPVVRAPDATVRARDVPTPRPAAPAATSAPASTAAAAAASSAAAQSTQTATQAPAAAASTAPGAARPSGAAPATTAAGQGPKPVPAPGSFPTPAKADDWGASTRNTAGGQRGEPQGLYDAEGGPRLTETPVNTGQPPGTLDDRVVDLDRSGTWLKRKPNDYEPTAFDKYWRPNETLLAEWVRKGIKKMAIPIPGTGKKIECLISVLALGGACGISDPNLNEQPAIARPPPDIPFKPHLQEDNGSVKPTP